MTSTSTTRSLLHTEARSRAAALRVESLLDAYRAASERDPSLSLELTRLAERERTSVSAVAIRELADVSRRVDNPTLLAALPDTGVGLDAIVDAVDGGSAER